MALHLITGYIGTEHVTADNAGHFNAQLVGEDSFVFGSGKKFEFNINSNNEIRVYDGQGCVNGRHFEMPSGTYEDLPISNGAQNMERNDLIVARYSIDPDTGIESISLAVIEGEPSSSTPSDPAYNGGSVLENAPTVDFPLYRVKIVGLSIESVDTLFSTKVNLQKQISTLDTKVSELNLKMGNKLGYKQIVTIKPNSSTKITFPYNSAGLIIFNGASASLFSMYQYCAFSNGLVGATISQQGTSIEYKASANVMTIKNKSTGNVLNVECLLFYGNFPSV